MQGLLIVDKPAGLTSTDVLRRLRRVLRLRKLGHGGTLDPFATGVLPVLVGSATRLAPYLLKGATKEYRAEVRLGALTDTLDCTGTVTSERPVPAGLGPAQVEAALAKLTGVIEQRVPAFSAVRVDGERLYRKAHRGEAVERPVRSVEIHELELEELTPPTLTVRVRCGSGTYVRALAEDLGILLGTDAHLSALRRLAVGPFLVSAAVALEGLDAAGVSDRLIAPADVLAHLPRVSLEPAEVVRVAQGQRLGAVRVPATAPEGGRVRLLDPSGELVAVGEVLPERRGIKVVRGLPVGG